MIIRGIKRKGETPLVCLERYRKDMEICPDVPMTYAGRLDPLARGVLPILTDEDVYKKDLLTSLSKVYRAEILFGISTDSYDVLGIPNVSKETVLRDLDFENIFPTGSFDQLYPPYSSKTYKGKQLWQWAREGMYPEVNHGVMVQRRGVLGSRSIQKDELLKHIETCIGEVSGDFRQKEIGEQWRMIPEQAYLVVKLELEVGSGFYVRAYANDAGRMVSVGACLLSLERTEIIGL